MNIEEIKKPPKTKENREKISKEILLSNDSNLNYYAILNLGYNKINHLLEIIKLKDPLLNFKCIKHCIKTKALTKDEKKILIAMHSQVILQSKNQRIINEMNNFFAYNSIDNYSKARSIKRKH